MALSERARKEIIVLGFAAVILATASAASSPTLTTSPWWEKVTYTISEDGAHQACRYESSIVTGSSGVCDEEDSTSPVQAASSSSGAYTKITIERRFTPGERPDPGTIESGDTLLGGQMMELAIDGSGTVSGCRVVAAAGEIRPAYGCDEAKAERFEAGASAGFRQGFMTILVYGHEEQLA